MTETKEAWNENACKIGRHLEGCPHPAYYGRMATGKICPDDGYKMFWEDGTAGRLEGEETVPFWICPNCGNSTDA